MREHVNAWPGMSATPRAQCKNLSSQIDSDSNPQVLGENVMLLRVLLESVGAAARAAGPRFASSGRLLRTVLLPTLERLGAQRAPTVVPQAVIASR